MAPVPLSGLFRPPLLRHGIRPIANVNVQIVLAASQLAPAVRPVVRVGDVTDEALARRAGAEEVIIPEVVSGEKLSGTP